MSESPVTRLARPEPIAPAPRTPPYDLEAEQALLGRILGVNNRAYDKVADFLRPEHFADPVHARIFEAIGKLLHRGQQADAVTLKAFFDQDGALAEVGGATYLARLAAAAAANPNSDPVGYGRVVHDLAVRRQLIDIGEDVVNRAFDHDIDLPAEDQIERAESALFELAETGTVSRGFLSFRDVLIETIELAEQAHRREGQLAGVPTGLTDLDKLLGGLHRSDLLVLAGRPGMGKTALATNIAFHAAATGWRTEGRERYVCAFFSLEMSADQLATRILSEQTEIQSERIRRGELSNEEFARLVEVSQTLESLDLHIDATPGLSIAQLRTRARRLKRQQGLDLLVVDYLQLMQGTTGKRHDNRVQEISEITRGLKIIAKEMEVPVLALSQLSRAVEQRENKKPLLSDLRESGTIEQDADVVMFVYREQYYLERDEPVRRDAETEERFNERMEQWRQRCENTYGLAEVIVAKQRHGPTGERTVRFEGATTRFSNYVPDDHLPESR